LPIWHFGQAPAHLLLMDLKTQARFEARARILKALAHPSLTPSPIRISLLGRPGGFGLGCIFCFAETPEAYVRAGGDHEHQCRSDGLANAWVDALNRHAYTAFDLGLTVLAALVAVIFMSRLWRLSVREKNNLPIP
jgi:hypothetical protein